MCVKSNDEEFNDILRQEKSNYYKNYENHKAMLVGTGNVYYNLGKDAWNWTRR